MQCACAILSPIDFPAVQYFPTLSHKRHPLHLSDFNKAWIISTDFQKILKIKFNENLVIKSNLVRSFSSMFISILYMFRANMCPSSGEITVSIRHLVLVTLGGWPSGMYSRRSSTQSDKYGVDTWYLSLCVDDRLVCIPDGHPHRVTNTGSTPGTCHSVWMTVWYIYQTVIHTERQIPGVALIQLFLLMMGTYLPETRRE